MTSKIAYFIIAFYISQHPFVVWLQGIHNTTLWMRRSSPSLLRVFQQIFQVLIFDEFLFGTRETV